VTLLLTLAVGPASSQDAASPSAAPLHWHDAPDGARHAAIFPPPAEVLPSAEATDPKTGASTGSTAESWPADVAVAAPWQAPACAVGCLGGPACGIAPGGGWAGLTTGLVFDGWLHQGSTWNTHWPDDRFNTPVTFNDRANDYQMNQLYLVLARPTHPCRGGWDVGGRVDLLYGTDYFFTTARGLETRIDGSPRWNSADGPRAGGGAALYGLAMPQLYAEVFAPILSGISVKLGHFYTRMGVESVMAPENFFYSHSYAMQYGQPFTGTGLMAHCSLTQRLSVEGGFTRGWDVWEDTNDNLSFLGGLRWTSGDRRTSLSWMLSTGSEDTAGDRRRTQYTLALTRHLGCRWIYILEHNYGVEDGVTVDREFQLTDAKWYGISQYLWLAANERTWFGLRLEWFRDQDNARVLGIPIEETTIGGNYTALTLGMNWRLNGYTVLRPEVRWDWSDVAAPNLGRTGMFDGFRRKDQFLFATDLIIRF
jgi:hypothetical protein